MNTNTYPDLCNYFSFDLEVDKGIYIYVKNSNKKWEIRCSKLTNLNAS